MKTRTIVADFLVAGTLAAFLPSVLAQDVSAVQLPSRQAVTANVPCSQDWQARTSVPIKVTDSLAISVPVKYIRYEMLTCGRPTDGVPRDGPSRSNSISFDFFMPDFSGYTPDRLRDSFDVHEVEVVYVAPVNAIDPNPSHPAAYPSNQLKNMLHLLADPNRYRDIYGLRCYEGRVLKSTEYCYSADAGQDHEGILILMEVPPYKSGLVNPQMRTNYYSNRYGGIEIAWRTNVNNLPRWRDIDSQIWKFLVDWNMVQPKE